MIAVSLEVGGGTSEPVHVPVKHYKHNEDGHTAQDVRGHGYLPLSHWGNVVTRTGLQQQLHCWQADQFRLSSLTCQKF